MTASGVIIVDKPEGISSFKVVQAVSRAYRKAKCGHAGTLDPMATGVLPVCVGRATKIAGHLTLADKEYDAYLRFGISTDTADATGKVIEERRGAFASREACESVVASLVGTFGQVPPAYSAIKVDGVRAYAMARKGEEPELAPRQVTVHAATILSWSEEGLRLLLHVSKGFYVRALPRDMGAVLGVPMTVAGLRRLRVGAFSVDRAVTLQALESDAKEGDPSSHLIRIEDALADWPQWEVPDEGLAAVRAGRNIGGWLSGKRLDPGIHALLVHPVEGAVAIVGMSASGLWEIVRGI